MDTDEAVFADRLMTGERLVWSGRPSPGLLFTARDVFLIPFSLMWCGFAIFWETSASSAGSIGVFMTIWGDLFVCGGLYLVAGRFAVDAWIRRATRYGLTDRRVLIVRANPLSNFTAIALERLPDASISERANGRGTIRFGQATSIWNSERNGFAIWSPALDSTPQFLAIPDARRVFDLIQLAARKP